jgi:hypothetical protein
MDRNGPRPHALCGAPLALALAAFGVIAPVTAPPAAAQDVTELTVPAPEYTLGRFKYQAPRTDGWRQMANVRQSLSLVYATQPAPDKIDTLFGVAMEAHDIPPNVQVPEAAALAETSRKQMAEARKADVKGMSVIEAVPSIENMYTYRFLVKSPIEGQPDGYEVYYVLMAPDKSQYLVAQCIAKEQNYGDQIYFNEFYGSLATLRYVPPGTPTGDAPKPDAAKPDAAKPDAAKPEAAKPAEPSKPAGGHDHDGDGHDDH